MNHKNRNNIPDEVSELSVLGTGFDRQSHTHHTNSWLIAMKAAKCQTCYKNESILAGIS